MNFINYSNINNQSFYKIFVFTIFSLLPISLVLGNLAININIIFADLSLIFYSIKHNDWKWTKGKFFKLLIIIQFYLIVSSINSIFFITNYEFFDANHKHALYNGLYRSLGFLKYILLVFSLSLMSKFNIKLDNLIKGWSIIIFIILFDVFFEKIYGNNILGNVSPDSTRIISFFGDEMIVGSYLLLFGFIISSYWLDKKNMKYSYKIFFNFLIMLIPFAVFVSGEKSNFIKSFICFSTLIYFIPRDKLVIGKKKLIFILIATLLSLFYFNDYTRIKYTETIKRAMTLEDNESFLNFQYNIKYFDHYYAAWEIFKDNPVLGVGNKNFRWECSRPKYFDKKRMWTSARCAPHPHQVHFELLSEQGLLGYILIMSIILNFIIRIFINSYKKNEIFKFSMSLYLIIFLIPLLPGGGIFSTYSGSNFWLIVALLNYLNNDEIRKRIN